MVAGANALAAMLAEHASIMAERSVGIERMIPEIDIWRVANLMIKRYGENAEVECVRRADEFAEAGDEGGASVWRRARRGVAELQIAPRQGGCISGPSPGVFVGFYGHFEAGRSPRNLDLSMGCAILALTDDRIFP
jgi:hypothetical protein